MKLRSDFFSILIDQSGIKETSYTASGFGEAFNSWAVIKFNLSYIPSYIP